jgi:hypothetical protein
MQSEDEGKKIMYFEEKLPAKIQREKICSKVIS